MQLSLLTRDQVVANMVATIQSTAAAGGFTISMNDGSAMLAMVNAVAGIYLWLQMLAVIVLSVARLSTSFGSDVDSFCGGDFNCPRLPGTASSGPAVFARYLTTSNAIIPVGAQVKTTDGTQVFTVIADSTNGAWQAPNTTYPNGSFLVPAGTANLTVSVQNTVVGTAGNIIAGAIGLVSGLIAGIDTVTNPASFENGRNVESDTAYKARFALYLPALACGTSVAATSATLGVQQNLSCAVLNGVQTVGGPFAPGYWVNAVDDGTGATPSATLAAVGGAVQAIAPLGSFGTTVQAPVTWATVVLAITCPNQTLKLATQPLVQAAISAYIGALKVSTNNTPYILPYSILSKLAYDASPNVTNVSAITLNGGTADLGGTPGTVVRCSSVTVN